MSPLVTYAIPAFIILLVLEGVVTTRRQMQAFAARDTATSLAMGLGSVAVNLGWKLVLFGMMGWVHERAAFELGNGPAPWVALFLLEDLTYYWFHRTHHEVRILWASHVVHHSSRRYNLATALRQTWTPMSGDWLWIPLAFLGFAPVMILTQKSISLLYQFWIHTETITTLPRPIELVCNTPSHHRVHHASNQQYLDRNYAGILIVWDRLFGTFAPEVEAPVYGLTKNIDTYNPLRVATHEYVAIARDVARATSWAERLGRVVRGPGWQPAA